MNVIEMEKILDAEYAVETGSLWLIRQGQFDKGIADRLLQALDKISFGEATCLPKNIVSMLWFIPVMLYWNQSRVLERSETNLNDYELFYGKVVDRLLEILGTP